MGCEGKEQGEEAEEAREEVAPTNARSHWQRLQRKRKRLPELWRRKRLHELSPPWTWRKVHHR